MFATHVFEVLRTMFHVPSKIFPFPHYGNEPKLSQRVWQGSWSPYHEPFLLIHEGTILLPEGTKTSLLIQKSEKRWGWWIKRWALWVLSNSRTVWVHSFNRGKRHLGESFLGPQTTLHRKPCKEWERPWELRLLWYNIPILCPYCFERLKHQCVRLPRWVGRPTRIDFKRTLAKSERHKIP